ncbi:hypothetical protein Pyn_37409 [Prunus yedoensis var. nudiflora]|uniref:Uncharacterized protein n=1 Tax=Prunus yedoensis var. nudiflora TaxID=2094558 RepID=A0A314U9E1_PRUYE|nr:hypothetical protein Pyn_37409 [Prunus yedoensis var. nudiflora]
MWGSWAGATMVATHWLSRQRRKWAWHQRYVRDRAIPTFVTSFDAFYNAAMCCNSTAVPKAWTMRMLGPRVIKGEAVFPSHSYHFFVKHRATNASDVKHFSC